MLNKSVSVNDTNSDIFHYLPNSIGIDSWINSLNWEPDVCGQSSMNLGPPRLVVFKLHWGTQERVQAAET